MDTLINRAAENMVRSKYAIALTGAGISTESGIRDFRGTDGIWTKNPKAERQAYESYGIFLRDPKKYWEQRFSQPALLGNLENVLPNPGHYALAELEEMDILKCTITQNIDGLHEKAGSMKVIEYHGSFYKLRCSNCNTRYSTDEFDLEKLHSEDQLPPKCKKCNSALKYDVVHFNESIPFDVTNRSMEETYKCDLMLICGTSAVVYPFANLPYIARNKTTSPNQAIYSQLYTPHTGDKATIIEVNAEPTPLTEQGISDYLIQGKTGEILPRIVEQVKILMTK
jgi:NAD-dependent deacetylase